VLDAEGEGERNPDLLGKRRARACPLFVHEFAGDVQSWRPQMSFFGRRYRAIAFNARGYLLTFR
jgi:pimeloyl-ACP methyl ester carboxylesterase